MAASVLFILVLMVFLHFLSLPLSLFLSLNSSFQVTITVAVYLVARSDTDDKENDIFYKAAEQMEFAISTQWSDLLLLEV